MQDVCRGIGKISASESQLKLQLLEMEKMLQENEKLLVESDDHKESPKIKKKELLSNNGQSQVNNNLPQIPPHL